VGAITLLLGGVRSGKSSLAVDIGSRFDGDVVFIATAQAFDADMSARIVRHRHERPPWPTVEAPTELAAAIGAAPPDSLLIIDCLTVWLGNIIHVAPPPRPGSSADDVTGAQAAEMCRALTRRAGPSVVVSNEVGMGVHPETSLGRRYRDDLGRVNQAIAAAATTTLLLVAGRAVRLNDPWELL
jgi:adenosylcobinamide kinase/adenosylcobinamide-phosphate guanylyltransferase